MAARRRRSGRRTLGRRLSGGGHGVARRSFVAVGLGALVLRRWAARRRPAQTSWTPPHGRQIAGVLPARVIGDAEIAIALLHGLFNSGRYWGGHYDVLAGGRAVVVPDLLGFGRAPRPASGYTADAHADAVAETLRDLGVRAPVVIGAHSVGGLVALRLAVRHPDLVGGIVAFAPPLYRDPAAARRQIASVDPLARLLVLNEAFGRWLCSLMCRFPKAAELLVRATRPTLPPPLAADRVEHSWASYQETLSSLVLSAEAPAWLRDVRVPVRLVAGVEDDALDLEFLADLASADPQTSLRLVDAAGHDIPLSHPALCVAEVLAAVAARSHPDEPVDRDGPV